MDLTTYIHQIISRFDSIPKQRLEVLQVLTNYLEKKQTAQEEISLNFVCTHNSRRSQLAQIWAQTAADYFGINCKTYSSGVEVTAFNSRAVQVIIDAGFQIQKGVGKNPIYKIHNGFQEVLCFSKLIEDELNPKTNFAAIMTCSHADKNCPVVDGMEARIPLNYEDPGKFDGTELEQIKYQERSEQIALEMFYVFGKVKGL